MDAKEKVKLYFTEQLEIINRNIEECGKKGIKTQNLEYGYEFLVDISHDILEILEGCEPMQ